jgi:hypothetical protein
MVMSEQAIDVEDAEHARAAVAAHLDRLAARGSPATGQILTSVGDHAAAGRVLAHHADDIDARTVAVGLSPHGPLVQFAEGSFTSALTHAARTTVVLVRPDEMPHELTMDAFAELRSQ